MLNTYINIYNNAYAYYLIFSDVKVTNVLLGIYFYLYFLILQKKIYIFSIVINWGAIKIIKIHSKLNNQQQLIEFTHFSYIHNKHIYKSMMYKYYFISMYCTFINANIIKCNLLHNIYLYMSYMYIYVWNIICVIFAV